MVHARVKRWGHYIIVLWICHLTVRVLRSFVKKHILRVPLQVIAYITNVFSFMSACKLENIFRQLMIKFTNCLI